MRNLTKAEIILANRLTIRNHSGQYISPNNFLNEGALDYLIDIVSSELFGEALYPKLSDRAGYVQYYS